MEPPKKKNFRETAQLYVARVRRGVQDYQREILRLARERDRAQLKFRIYTTVFIFIFVLLVIIALICYFWR